MRGYTRSFTFTSLFVGVLALMIFLAPFSISQNPTKEPTGTPPGWSNEINLSKSVLQDQWCQIDSTNDAIHIVWVNNGVNITHIKSNDGGRNWSSKGIVYMSNWLATYPDLAISDLCVHLVWCDEEGWNGIYYRNSTNDGVTWNSVKRLSQMGVNAGDPSIFVNKSNIHVIWNDKRDGSDGEIYYRRSIDGGIFFDNGQGIDEDRRITFSPAAISGVATAGNGSNISVVWADERNGNFDIYWMTSKDNGYLWEDGLGTPNVGRKLTDSTYDCTQPAIIVNGSQIHIVWMDEQWPGPVYRLYYRNSTDNGLTWNPIQLLTGPVPGINSPDISVEGNKVYVVWDDERDDGDHEEIYYKNSNDGGFTWSDDLRLTYNLSSSSYWPRISVENDTKHVVWYDLQADNQREVYYKRSPDFPDATAPSHSNETPLPDSYKDAPGTNISIHVTDPSGVNASTIQLWVNGSLVPHVSTPITDGYNVSWVSGGFGPGIVACRIIAEDMLGNVLDYTWNFTVLALYEIQLQEGWNLVSLPLEQVNTSILSVMASIGGKWDVVKYYGTLDKADPWKTYRIGSSMNDLTVIDNTMGFWIKITEPNVNLTVRGSIPTYTTISLYAGWNLVGYPTQTTQTVGNALWGTGADRVEVFDPVSPYIKEVGATYVMKPGEGYWVHVTADTIWTINW